MCPPNTQITFVYAFVLKKNCKKFVNRICKPIFFKLKIQIILREKTENKR